MPHSRSIIIRNSVPLSPVLQQTAYASTDIIQPLSAAMPPTPTPVPASTSTPTSACMCNITIALETITAMPRPRQHRPITPIENFVFGLISIILIFLLLWLIWSLVVEYPGYGREQRRIAEAYKSLTPAGETKHPLSLSDPYPEKVVPAATENPPSEPQDVPIASKNCSYGGISQHTYKDLQHRDRRRESPPRSTLLPDMTPFKAPYMSY
ncbi:hypothetical protein GALMADRAFT_604527 [Galerina marginata CBS 339.88]|uniref:Uncharacterized protein n=1 Tax=Galerina marginata (strain CBS 339.88) TaxID=685588 RepID=A0A067ST52_GALM3|nr:hypothetical protein GALMADRAFT_604527 [Galerina marginata CBS 339.88]